MSRISPGIYFSGVACGDWSEQDARVVCRQAGFIGLEISKAGNIIFAHKNTEKIAHLGCNGNESGIAQCTPKLKSIGNTCGGQKSLAIKCTSKTICTTLHTNVRTCAYIHTCTIFHVTYIFLTSLTKQHSFVNIMSKREISCLHRALCSQPHVS